MDYLMRPIGMIHSPFTNKKQTPIQPTRSQEIGRVEVFPEFVNGLQDLEGFTHIILLYIFHQSNGYTLLVSHSSMTSFTDCSLHVIPAVLTP